VGFVQLAAPFYGDGRISGGFAIAQYVTSPTPNGVPLKVKEHGAKMG
jgi:hypothetical protein